MEQWFEKYTSIRLADLIALFISYAIKLVAAIVLLIIGFWLIGRLLKVAERTLEARNFDLTYKRFIRKPFKFYTKDCSCNCNS
jgi:uncharacterized membrane protein (Fun14 family)